MTAFIQPLAECQDVAHVGGKAANLGKLIRAGFPVPGGFAVTTAAYAEAHRAGPPEGGTTSHAEACTTSVPAALAEEIRAAYRALGAPPVAVRSSATAEDMADASMAGQYETYLDIRGEEQLLAAINRCWESINSPRIRAYFREHGIAIDRVAMAVAVQQLVAAEVAGVLFTVNPNAAPGNARREMLVEASWGLGEMVVSGRVQPDVVRLDAASGNVLSTVIADKRTQLIAGNHDEQPVGESLRRAACLSPEHLQQLHDLGQKAVAHFGGPQDLEWALMAGKIYLLQSRPITTLKDADAVERVLTATREQLKKETAAKRGPWVVHNLGETLPHPTPLTWSILQPFMAGAGGFGEMYRQAGFQPGPRVEHAGFLELIAGRIYMDAARAPEMFFADFPFAYDLEELKRSPDASQSPPTLPRGSLRSRFKTGRRLAAVQERLRTLARDTDRQLHDSLFPSITHYVADAREVDLAKLSTEQLIERWLLIQDQVLDSLAPQLLMPSLISGMALAELRAFLAEHFWQEDPDALSQFLSSGSPPNRTVLADAELHAVGKGEKTLDSWLTNHGHRAAGEFDIAAPRWREQPDNARDMAARLATGENPLDRHRKHGNAVVARADALRAQLAPRDRIEFDRRLDLVRRYLPFREDGKDFLMLGYDLLRDIALEAGRRLGLGEDIFYLTQNEVFEALRSPGAAHNQKSKIENRKSQYNAETRIDLPRVIDAATIDTLGHPAPIAATSGGHTAFAVSMGRAKGPARILTSPNHAGDLGKGYILVCPSTDPSWTPLFVNAAGLVLECGGTLSHGAVVAREMGLPAVVLPDATKIFKEGQEITLDGTAGWVGTSQSPITKYQLPITTDPTDTRIPFNQLPPPQGPKDRRAARIRNIFAACWGLFLLGFFLLPESSVQQPSLHVIDALLWPLVRSLGKPGTVALVAAVIALATLLIQKFATDNPRLLEAKRRAAALQKEANALPRGTARRKTLAAVAASVTPRTLAAAMVPIGILLGPLVMPFVWFQDRVDPSVVAAPAGSTVEIRAMVDADCTDPVQIKLPGNIQLDMATPQARTLPPLHGALDHLLALYKQPDALRNTAWETKLGPADADAAGDLQAFLAHGVPAQGIKWSVAPPDDFSGSFPVTVTAGGKSLTATVVLGDTLPPSPALVRGGADSPIKELHVDYPRAKVEPVFWEPLPHVHVSWLWVYILAYIPILMIARPLLKVA